MEQKNKKILALLRLVAALALFSVCAAPAAALGERPAPGTPPAEEVSPLRSWTDCPVVAHALGSVDGRAGTNSREAMLASLGAGHRVLEVDLQLTRDKALVARHDWDQISYYNLEQVYAGVMDRRTFLSTPICFYYTPVDIDGILELMKEYPDVFIVTDSKAADEQTVRAQFRALSAAVARAGDPGLWDRIVVQIYREEMLSWVKKEAPVTNWIFTLYQIDQPDYAAIGAFCRDNGIPVVTMEAGRLNGTSASALHSYGCKIYVHTVNRLRTMLELSWAADGFYSDCVTPSQLEGVLTGKAGRLKPATN